jgi:hypothetical protein
MTHHGRLQKVPGALAERLYVAVQRYRNASSRFKRPEDLRQLIRIFPNVTVAPGYNLDYLPMGGPKSSWIWPFAKAIIREGEQTLPPQLGDLARDQLAAMRGTLEGVQIAKQTLYSHLRYPNTQLGLFEYAFFVMELWATKSEVKASEWLSLSFLFSRHSFDNLILKSNLAKRIRRPEGFEPMVQLDPEGGGRVQFLAYNAVGWKRAFQVVLIVDSGGHVGSKPGPVLVDLGR